MVWIRYYSIQYYWCIPIQEIILTYLTELPVSIWLTFGRLRLAAKGESESESDVSSSSLEGTWRSTRLYWEESGRTTGL